MSIRVYICPWVGTGTRQDPYRSKAENLGYKTPPNNLTTFSANTSEGPPASTWMISFIRSDDFSAIEADPTCDDLFGGDLPSSLQTRDDLLAFLRSRTVGDVPTSRRNAITAVLDKYGIARADFTTATPLWKVMRRVASTLFEQDDNFASAF